MNDYPYPLPPGVDSLETDDDWRRIEPLEGNNECWEQQLTALGLINDALGSEALFIDTIFSPWTTARRMCGRRGIIDAMRRNPELLLTAMEHISTSLANYAVGAISRGASGIFLSLGGATEDVMSADEYQTWCRPFDLRILEAASAEFNVVHIHGKRIHFKSVCDFPAAAFNWSLDAGSPSLQEGRERSGKAVMGGINEARIAQSSPGEIRDEVTTVLRETGTRALLITPGCSVPTDTPERNLRALREALLGGGQ
jgi:uroporphyrinogen decarboxylase